MKECRREGDNDPLGGNKYIQTHLQQRAAADHDDYDDDDYDDDDDDDGDTFDDAVGN